MDGEFTEDTFDWYAQDKAVNVWYFGEDTKTLENGEKHELDARNYRVKEMEAGIEWRQPVKQFDLLRTMLFLSGDSKTEYCRIIYRKEAF